MPAWGLTHRDVHYRSIPTRVTNINNNNTSNRSTPSPIASPKLVSVKPATIIDTADAEQLFSARETDAQCWERMLSLQQQYHCYNSARLEAVIEALERGVRIEEVPIPSRLCLNLLNESLRSWIEAHREGLVC